jgi:hypothetical protein
VDQDLGDIIQVPIAQWFLGDTSIPTDLNVDQLAVAVQGLTAVVGKLVAAVTFLGVDNLADVDAISAIDTIAALVLSAPQNTLNATFDAVLLSGQPG